MSQDIQKPPSDILRVSEWASDLTGLPGDWWTAYQLDSAVSWAGRYLESKLQELDDQHKPRHTLESLLADNEKASNAANKRMLLKMIKPG